LAWFACGARVAFAQSVGAVRRIGFLYFGSRQAAIESGRYAAFMRGMTELGYVEGNNVSIEARFADNRADRVPALIDDLMRLRPELIVATATPAYDALRRAGVTIPVVVTVTVDPVAEGLAASLARPGGNMTGLSVTADLLGPKHVELLVAAAPRLARVAVLTNPDNSSHSRQRAAIAAAVQSVGRQVMTVEARSVKDLDAGFAAMARERADALIILGDTFFTDQMRRVADLALANRVASAHSPPAYAEAGGLLSYGPDLTDNFRRAAVFVDKILKGAKPGELPFEQPTDYRLVVNLKTARALGLTIPQSMLISAERVIE